jgi:sulfoxide reductase heme-binding subunit YedZ
MMATIQSVLRAVQKFVLPRRKQFIWLFVLAESGLLGLWLVCFAIARTNFEAVSELIFSLGSKLGTFSLICYLITLVPGIVTRLQWLPLITQPVGSMLMIFRRHFGILMFISAFVHMSFTTTLPQLVFNNFEISQITLQTYHVMGILGWWILFPLWLTSNDVSVKKLGVWWKRVHMLTYTALFFIFLHVALQLESWAVVLAGVMVLEIISWALFLRRQSRV